MPLAFERDSWMHSMTASKLVYDGKLHRKNNLEEYLKGIIFHADLDDKDIEKYNLQLFLDNNIPCFPNPAVLLKMQDRHIVLKQCMDWGYTNRDREFLKRDEFKWDGKTVVIKTGNSHHLFQFFD
jgi:hypothetical protein